MTLEKARIFSIVLEVPSRVIRQEKVINGIHADVEEVKRSLFRVDMIVCIGNPKKSTKKEEEKLIRAISELSSIIG